MLFFSAQAQTVNVAAAVGKRISIAKPELAPHGDRAIECFKKAGLYEKIKHKIVYADNISRLANLFSKAKVITSHNSIKHT